LFDYRLQGYSEGSAPRPSYYNGLWWADSLKIKLLVPPLIPGSSTITYVAEDGTEQVLEAGTDYQEDAYTKPARLYPNSGAFWPWIKFNTPCSVKITYDAGMGDEAALQTVLTAYKNGSPAPSNDQVLAREIALRQAVVPGYVKAAILLLVGHMYEHREEVSELRLTQIPMGVERLLSMYAVVEFAHTKG